MQSVMIVLMGIAGMSFGWFVYSKFIAEKIYQLQEDFVTPAHELAGPMQESLAVKPATT